MTRDPRPRHLDMRALAAAGARLEGNGILGDYARLMAETQGQGGERPLTWRAQAELRKLAGRPEQVWLRLQANATLPLTCQRCLGPMEATVEVDREFRFLPDEASAAAEDEAAEEDVLVLAADFDLLVLVEDELLMAMPVVPRHDACPVQPVLVSTDAGFDEALAAASRPFEALRALRREKP